MSREEVAAGFSMRKGSRRLACHCKPLLAQETTHTKGCDYIGDNMISLDLKNKVTVITGAAQGIGKSIVLKFAQAGSDIAIFDVLKKEGEDVISDVIALGRKGSFYKVDVTDKAQVNEAVKRVLNEYGKINFLINNAGITSKVPFVQLSLGVWQKTLDVNLTGAFLCCKAVARAMVKQKNGRIVLISSGSAITGSGGGAHYASSKGGINSLVRALSRELAPYNILVNGIAPRNIISGTLKNVYSREKLRNLADKVLLKRLGTSKEVANVALFLSSEFSTYITGQIILVDGGRTFGGS